MGTLATAPESPARGLLARGEGLRLSLSRGGELPRVQGGSRVSSQLRMQPADRDPLANRYWVMRHGHSEANRQSLIVSDPARGTTGYGLSERGRAEVSRTIAEHQSLLSAMDKIYSSDFLRARQTAELVGSHLGIEVELSEALRERRFGTRELQSTQHYAAIWGADRHDPHHQQWQVESVAAVAARLQRWLGELDQQSRDQNYLLVSHGDPLQILLLAAGGGDVRDHRALKPLATAELRPLT